MINMNITASKLVSKPFLEKATPEIRFYDQFPFRSNLLILFSCPEIESRAKLKNGPFSSEIVSYENISPLTWMTF